MKNKLIKGLLTFAVAVVVLCGGVIFGYGVSADSTPDEDKPAWQLAIEERVFPLMTSASVSAVAYYILTLAASKKIKAAAAKAELSALGFDGAAVNLEQVRAALVKSVSENESLRAEVTAMRADQAQMREMLLAGIKMIGLGFSHEAELVRNGTAREIMEMEERYEGKT